MHLGARASRRLRDDRGHEQTDDKAPQHVDGQGAIRKIVRGVAGDNLPKHMPEHRAKGTAKSHEEKIHGRSIRNLTNQRWNSDARTRRG